VKLSVPCKVNFSQSRPIAYVPRLRDLLSAVLTVAPALPALADGFFAAGEGGWSHLMDKRTFSEGSPNAAGPQPGLGVQDIWGNGYAAGARFGYQWGPWRLEEEGVFRDNPLSQQLLFSTASGHAIQDGVNTGTGGHRRSLAAMTNVLFDVDLQWMGLDWPVSPHLGVGVGAAQLFAFTRGQNTTITDSTDTEFAYQGIIGIHHEFDDTLEADLDWRYFATTDPTFTRTTGTRFLSNYENQTLMLSLVYRFRPAGPR
jgi:OmpA-OmpF porin, OOP family